MNIEAHDHSIVSKPKNSIDELILEKNLNFTSKLDPLFESASLRVFVRFSLSIASGCAFRTQSIIAVQ